MFHHHLMEMVAEIAKEQPTLDKVKARESLEDYWKDKIAAVWCLEDVRASATNNGFDLTQAECIRALQLAHRDMDAETGINWTTIDIAINMVVDQRD